MYRLWFVSISLACAGIVEAQPFEVTYAASFGSASATCGPRTTPCSSLSTAIQHTSTGGVVKFEDAGPYTFTILDRNVIIDGSGINPVLTGGGSSAAALFITGGPATVKSVTVECEFLNAIVIDTAQKTIFEDVVVRPGNAFGTAILAQNTVTILHLRNVSISGLFLNGITQNSGTFTLDHVSIVDAGQIGYLQFAGTATIRDSLFEGGLEGLNLGGSGGLIERSEISGNSSFGLVVANAAVLRLADSVITGNGTGILPTAGGQIISYRTNMLAGNTTDGATPFSVSLK